MAESQPQDQHLQVPNAQSGADVEIKDMNIIPKSAENSSTKRNANFIRKVISKAKSLCSVSESEKIERKIMKAFQVTDPVFQESDELNDFLSITFNKLHEDPINVFVHILELKNELDAHKAYSLLVSSKHSDSDTSYKMTNDIDSKLEERLLKLERFMKKLEKKIEKLKLRELTLHDLDDLDSVYIYLGKYLKKFDKAWKLYCRLTSSSVRTGRPVEKSIKFEGSRYPELNDRIELFLNNERNSFPDFCDIHNLVAESNKTDSLGLSSSSVSNLASEIFEDIGKIFKSRRVQDFCNNSLFMPNPSMCDPALEDATLQAKLNDNDVESKNNLDKVFDKYVDIQLSQKETEKSEGEYCESGCEDSESNDETCNDLDDCEEEPIAAEAISIKCENVEEKETENDIKAKSDSDSSENLISVGLSTEGTSILDNYDKPELNNDNKSGPIDILQSNECVSEDNFQKHIEDMNDLGISFTSVDNKNACTESDRETNHTNGVKAVNHSSNSFTSKSKGKNNEKLKISSIVKPETIEIVDDDNDNCTLDSNLEIARNIIKLSENNPNITISAVTSLNDSQHGWLCQTKGIKRAADSITSNQKVFIKQTGNHPDSKNQTVHKLRNIKTSLLSLKPDLNLKKSYGTKKYSQEPEVITLDDQ